MILASEISTCVRRAYYSAANVPKQDLVPHDTAMRFLQGHVMHELLQSALRQGALLTMEKHPELRIHFEPEIEVGETPLGKELNLHSSCDGVVTFEQLDQGEWSVLARIGVEFKTMAGSTWTKNASPQKEHIEQALVYMATLDLGMMWFAYVSKDNLAVTPFASPYNYAFDEAAWQQVRAKIETVIEAVKKRSAPEVKASSYCYSCTYKPICDPHKQDVVWRK
jgi:CRISPR/Cas system-associated exonuclease Cas4 (RecB family)